MRLFWSLLLFAALSTAQAEVLPGSPQDRSYAAPPVRYTQSESPPYGRENWQAWQKEYFEGPELFYFPSREAFEEKVNSWPLTDEEKSGAKSKWQTVYSTEEVRLATDWMPLPRGAAGGFFLPNEWRKRMSQQDLQRLYEQQLPLQGTPRDSFAVPNRENLIQLLTPRRTALSPAERAELDRQIVFLAGKWHLPLNSGTWPLLHYEAKAQYVAGVTNSVPSRGVDAFVRLEPGEDLHAVARFYAGEGDPRALQRYLGQLKARSRGKPIDVPLRKILPAFIRKRLDTFAACHGPNCFNAALNVAKGNAFSVGYTLFDELNEALKNDYRLAESGERFRPGDLLVYRNAQGQALHVAVVAGDGAVFTKNGMHKARPYVLQPKAVVDAIYLKPEMASYVGVYKAKAAYRLPAGACGLDELAP